MSTFFEKYEGMSPVLFFEKKLGGDQSGSLAEKNEFQSDTEPRPEKQTG